MNSPTAAAPVSAPVTIEANARAWAAPLLETVGSGLRALYVYGSALRPGFDPEKSDVNLLLVVRDTSFAAIDALAKALRAPRTAPAGTPGKVPTRFTPLVLSEETLRRSPDVFPLDFLDLLERRALLAGEDLLADIRLSLANLRHQCEYELRSKLIGVRQSYLASRGTEGAAHDILVRAAGGSGALYRHLLTLRGAERPDARDALAHAVSAAYGADVAGLAAPFAERAETLEDDARARTRLAAYLGALERLIVAVDELPTA